MRAVVIVDKQIAVAERPEPEPAAGELLVRVASAGLNGADLMQRAGLYPPPAGLPPDMPGLELAGEVVGLGEGTSRFQLGERVMALVGGAAQAELAVVPEETAISVPDALGIEEAGGLPEVFVTAHDALFTQCGLSPGDRVLVSGAAGGVGLAGVQLAAAAGAEVTASVRRAELREAVAAFGATAVDPAEVAEHGPFDVVLELVGAPNLGTDLQALAIGGRIVVIGVGGGARSEIDLLQIMGRRAVLRGSTLRARTLDEKGAAVRAAAERVLPLVESGKVRVPVEARFALAQAADAYERFAAGGKLGKILLDLSAPAGS